jgi:hypothetical protein
VRQLRPIDRVEVDMLGTDRHQQHNSGMTGDGPAKVTA